MKSLASRLKKIRGKLTQKDFSIRVGVSQSSYSLYEQGQRIPDAVFLNRVCDLFDVDPGWLLSGRGNMCRDTDEGGKPPTVGDYSENKNLQPIEKNNIKKLAAADVGGCEADLIHTLHENATLLRQNGDLRVEVERLHMDIERRDTRIAELERQLVEALKPRHVQTVLGQGGAAVG